MKYRIEVEEETKHYIDPGNRNYDFSETVYKFVIYKGKKKIQSFDDLKDAKQYLKRKTKP